MKKILILGATGSIGVQTIDVCENLGYEIVGITANTNYEKLLQLQKRCNAKYLVINDENGYTYLKNNSNCIIYQGVEGIKQVISEVKADIIVNAIVGNAGIIPTIEALKNCKRLALANKETLVSAGEIVMKMAALHKCELIPIDSEHSAIFQSMDGQIIKKIHLTASGGPFLGYTPAQLKKVTKKDALKHPNWAMGQKITIDSATLMNKGLEVIEAKWLFDVLSDQIEVVVHPESIIHSMVEYMDNSIIAQLGAHDMRIPIQYALTYPKRVSNKFNTINLFEIGQFNFLKADTETFRCLQLAYDAINEGKTMPLVLNTANEIAVGLFLKEKISFINIGILIEKVMNRHHNIYTDDINELLEIDSEIRSKTMKWSKECQ